MDCNWCICGKQVYESDSLYCSRECQSMEFPNTGKCSSMTVSTARPDSPQVNYRFSVGISTSHHQHNANEISKNNMISPPSSCSSYTDSNLSTSLTIDRDHQRHQRHHSHQDDFYTNDEEYYYRSNSVPIEIPRSPISSDHAFEINKGTFGEDKQQF